MKKFLVTLLSAIMLVAGVAFVAACSDNADVLKTYILKQEGKTVDEEFELPNTIGGKKVTWTSSDTSLISIEKGDDCYIAKVNMASEAQTVTLTVAQGKSEKKFEVTVLGLDVYYIVDNYKFPQNALSVYEDFDLATTYTYKGATAEISWEIDNKYSDYITLNAEKNKCLVTPTSLNPSVEIKAEFKYNNETASAKYKMTVSLQRTHLEEIDYWYNNTGVSIEIKGYVVAVDKYEPDNTRSTLYIIDDDYCAGFYAYRATTDAENGALLAPGVHVTITGTTNQNYNGLIETNAGGKLVVDKDADGNVIKIDNVLEKVYALDNDLLSNAPAAVYNESRMVSLDKWTVESKPDSAPASGATGTLFTLKKGEVKVAVIVSKYLNGVYDTTNAEHPVYKPLMDLYTSVNVGDVISVKGILGNYNGYQIMPLSASDVVKGGEATTVPELCAKVDTAIKAVKGVLNGDLVEENKQITIPATDGVTITSEILGKSNTVTLADNVFTVTIGKEENVSVKVTYTVGDYSTVTFHNIHTRTPSDEIKVEDALKAIKDTLSVSETGNTTLATSEKVTLTWKEKEGTTLPEGIIVADGKLSVANLPAEETTIVLTVTATSGDVTETKDVTVTIAAGVDSQVAGIILSLNHTKLNKTLYLTGEMSGYYYATSENPADAADIVVTEVEGGYTIQANGKYLEIVKSGTYINVKLNDTVSDSVWTYDSELKVYTWAIDEDKYFLGTDASKTYNTISAVHVDKISTSCVAVVEEYVEEGTFKFALQQKNLDKKLYFTGEMNGYYYATTEDVSKAADVVVAKVEGGYTLKTGDKYLELVKSGTYINVKLNETSNGGVWVYDFELKVFTWDLEGTKYYLGTYNTFNTISASAISKLDGSFPAKFEKVKAAEEEEEGPAGTPATLTFGNEINAESEKISSYSGEYEATRNDFTYTIKGFNNNNNGWDHIRTGSKNNDMTGTITTQKVAPAVNKVVVTINSVTATNVNSFKLKVYSNAGLTELVTEVSCDIAVGENTFTIAADKVGAGYYYQIEIDCKKASNGFVQLSKVEFTVAE